MFAFKIQFGLATAVFLLAACQTNQTVSLEEAKQISAKYHGSFLAPPPKSITDITQVLENQPPADLREVARNSAIADKQRPAGAQGRQLVAFLLKRGLAAKAVGRIKQAIADLHEAETMSRTYGDALRREVIWELGLAETQGGNPSKNIAYKKEAVDLVKNLDRGIGYTATLAIYASTAGDLNEARTAIAKSEALLRDAASRYSFLTPIQTYRLKLAKAVLAQVTGKYAEAEEQGRNSLRDLRAIHIKSVRDKKNLAGIGSRLAQILVKAGKLVEAEVVVRDALNDALNVAGKYTQYTANTVNQLARVLREQGRLDEAEKLAKVVLDIQQKVGMPQDSAKLNEAHASLGDIYVDQGRWQEALEKFDGVKKRITADTYFRKRILDHNPNWALALAKTGKLREARAAAESLVAILTGRLGPKHADTAEAKGILAVVLAASRDNQKALALFHEAVPNLLARARQSEGEASVRSGRIKRLGMILDAYINLLVNILGSKIEKEYGIDAAAEAFRIADVARSQSVQGALTASGARAAAGNPDLADLVAREQDAQKQIASLFGLLALRLIGSPASRSRCVRASTICARPVRF